jgi:1,4-dihydroxy-2-naphthoate octaprenyltransferase
MKTLTLTNVVENIDKKKTLIGLSLEYKLGAILESYVLYIFKNTYLHIINICIYYIYIYTHRRVLYKYIFGELHIIYLYGLNMVCVSWDPL